jgi:hypothetical protein
MGFILMVDPVSGNRMGIDNGERLDGEGLLEDGIGQIVLFRDLISTNGQHAVSCV